MTREFKEYHDVSIVHTQYVNGGCLVTVVFNDGRSFDGLIVNSSYYNIDKMAQDIIINNSMIQQRKDKINKICQKMN